MWHVFKSDLSLEANKALGAACLYERQVLEVIVFKSEKHLLKKLNISIEKKMSNFTQKVCLSNVSMNHNNNLV